MGFDFLVLCPALPLYVQLELVLKNKKPSKNRWNFLYNRINQKRIFLATKKFFFGEGGTEDEPSDKIQLAVNFINFRDERAYVELVDMKSPDLITNEPKAIQQILKEKRLAQLDENYAHLVDGNR